MRGRKVTGQLISSAGSISANIEEGYGRGLRTREYDSFLRYSLGSAKEVRGWYVRGRHLLPTDLVTERVELATDIIGLLSNNLEQQMHYRRK